MKETVFTGCIPALMTPCTPDRRRDFDALVRKGRELIQAGMSALVYCGSMGDWPLLSDAQRMEGVERLVGAGGQGGPVGALDLDALEGPVGRKLGLVAHAIWLVIALANGDASGDHRGGPLQDVPSTASMARCGSWAAGWTRHPRAASSRPHLPR